MPRNRGYTGEQWFDCHRCGKSYPMSRLGWQEGLQICWRQCWDQKTVEQGDKEQARIFEMIARDSDEGADTRFRDPIFFGEENL